MRVELIRHGETLWQGTGRYQGQTDVPLSEQGRQALSPASFSPEKVYITALQRTRQTAERLFPQARLVVVEDLGEMNFGRFEGRSAAEMEEDPFYRAWVEGMCRGQCPGGESLPAFSPAHRSTVPGWRACAGDNVQAERVCLRFPAVSAGPSPDCWIGRWPLRKSSLFLWSTGEPRWR